MHLYANLLECLSGSLGCEKCRFAPPPYSSDAVTRRRGATGLQKARNRCVLKS